MANMEITIQRCDSLALLNQALDKGLYQAVDECFSGPPFNSVITREKVEFYFEKYVRSGILHLAYCNEKPIGFLGTVPLIETKDFRHLSLLGASVNWQGQTIVFNQEFLMRQTQHTIEDFQYVGDVGVALDYRRQGVARKLFQTLFAYFDASTSYILRVASDPDYAYVVQLYQKVGFTILPVTQIVEYSDPEGQLVRSHRLLCVKLPPTPKE